MGSSLGYCVLSGLDILYDEEVLLLTLCPKYVEEIKLGYKLTVSLNQVCQDIHRSIEFSHRYVNTTVVTYCCIGTYSGYRWINELELEDNPYRNNSDTNTYLFIKLSALKQFLPNDYDLSKFKVDAVMTSDYLFSIYKLLKHLNSFTSINFEVNSTIDEPFWGNFARTAQYLTLLYHYQIQESIRILIHDICYDLEKHNDILKQIDKTSEFNLIQLCTYTMSLVNNEVIPRIDSVYNKYSEYSKEEIDYMKTIIKNYIYEIQVLIITGIDNESTYSNVKSKCNFIIDTVKSIINN